MTQDFSQNSKTGFAFFFFRIFSKSAHWLTGWNDVGRPLIVNKFIDIQEITTKYQKSNI
jgi:hypothetical protein